MPFLAFKATGDISIDLYNIVCMYIPTQSRIDRQRGRDRRKRRRKVSTADGVRVLPQRRHGRLPVLFLLNGRDRVCEP